MGALLERRSDMPLTDWKLWACASETLRQHGADAKIFAAMRIDRLEASGYFKGAKAWREIIRRIDELLSKPEVLN